MRKIWTLSLLLLSIPVLADEEDGRRFRCVSTHVVRMGQWGSGSDDKVVTFSHSGSNTQEVYFENSRTVLQLEARDTKVVLTYQSAIASPVLRAQVFAKKTAFGDGFEIGADSASPFGDQSIHLCCTRMTSGSDDDGGSVQ